MHQALNRAALRRNTPPPFHHAPLILALDTEVLIQWMLGAAPHHRPVRRLIEGELRAGHLLGLTPQACIEFVRAVTNPNQLRHPLPTDRAQEIVNGLWSSSAIVRLEPGPRLLSQVSVLMDGLHLDRHCLLEATLAATLEQAGVHRLATFNEGAFRRFPFLRLVIPR